MYLVKVPTRQGPDPDFEVLRRIGSKGLGEKMTQRSGRIGREIGNSVKTICLRF